MDDPRTQDEFVQLNIFRCGRGIGDHATLFQGAFSPPVPCKVLQRGRRQMSKLPIVDQRYFQEHKVPFPVHETVSLFEPQTIFSVLYWGPPCSKFRVSKSFAALQVANPGIEIRFDLLFSALTWVVDD